MRLNKNTTQPISRLPFDPKYLMGMTSTMANWETPRHTPKATSRWPAPGIFVNVEFGVSFAPEHRTHTTSMKYTSRRMEERLHQERIRQQYEQGYSPEQLQPTSIMPARIHEQNQARLQQQERQRRLGVRTTEQHERGTSAPPTTVDRSQPISPISPVSPIGTIGPLQCTRSLSSQIVSPLQHTRSLPSERTNQALPPTPSQFRLGDEDMPWSMPPWYRDPEPEFASPPNTRREPPQQRQAVSPPWTRRESEQRQRLNIPEIVSPPRSRRESEQRHERLRLDDPQRVKDLETLHQAMMTVDSLGSDGWEPWTRASWGDQPRVPPPPRSIGWAVSSEDAPTRVSTRAAELTEGPPPYVVSQWEKTRRDRNRPRSSCTT